MMPEFTIALPATGRTVRQHSPDPTSAARWIAAAAHVYIVAVAAELRCDLAIETFARGAACGREQLPIRCRNQQRLLVASITRAAGIVYDFDAPDGAVELRPMADR